MKVKKQRYTEGKFTLSKLRAKKIKSQKRCPFQRLLLDVTRVATSPGDIDTKVQNILNLIGNHTNVTRICLFEDNQHRTTAYNKYEWCNQGVDLKLEWPAIRYQRMPSWKLLLDTNGCIVSDDITSLPDDIQVILSAQRVKSILVLPIKIRETISGFLLFRECVVHREWTRDDVDLLETVSNVLANVFELERTNSDLIESEKRFRQTFRLNPSLMLITTLEDGVILDVNDFFLEKSGFHNDDIIGIKTTEINLITQSTRDEIICRLKKDNCVRNLEFKYCFVDKEYYGLYNASILEMDGGKYIISSFQNITPIKESENELTILRKDLEKLVQVRTNQLMEAKDAAEQSDRLKTAFLQTVSHELRTPLNSIMGFSELIEEDESIETIMEYRDYILNSGKKLLYTIEDMLEVSRMEAGQLTLHIDQIDIFNELNFIKNKFAHSTKYCEKDIELKLNFPENIKELWGYTDVRCLRQIFEKLLENAYTYTQHGLIEFGILQEESDLVFFVKDTGIGIASEDHNIIFENFRQVDDSANRKYGGLGIGLALTKKTIEAMGGQIRVESEIGKGACFYFTLPLRTTHGDNKCPIPSLIHT